MKGKLSYEKVDLPDNVHHYAYIALFMRQKHGARI